MIFNMAKLILIMLSIALISGCAASKRGDVYTRDQAKRVQTVEMGKVIAVRDITIEGTKSNVGTVGGAVIGGIAGSGIGGGRGSAIAATVGAIVGGIAGAAAEEGVTRQSAVELTVQLDNGRVVAIVQALSHENEFAVNERVRVIHDGRESRVHRAAY
jgi:outer membrane lipoprotein SlyB